MACAISVSPFSLLLLSLIRRYDSAMSCIRSCGSLLVYVSFTSHSTSQGSEAASPHWHCRRSMRAPLLSAPPPPSPRVSYSNTASLSSIRLVPMTSVSIRRARRGVGGGIGEEGRAMTRFPAGRGTEVPWPSSVRRARGRNGELARWSAIRTAPHRTAPDRAMTGSASSAPSGPVHTSAGQRRIYTTSATRQVKWRRAVEEGGRAFVGGSSAPGSVCVRRDIYICPPIDNTVHAHR